MPSRRNRRKRNADGNVNDIPPLPLPPPPPPSPPSPPSQPPSVFDFSEVGVEIPRKYVLFIENIMKIKLGKYDSETLKTNLSPDQKQILINQMMTTIPELKGKEKEAYAFFDYTPPPKITKKIKEPITNEDQKTILDDLIAFLATSSKDTKTTATTTTEKKKDKQLFTPEKMSVAINIKALSKSVDLSDEESIKQKISQYADLIKVIKEDSLNFTDYYTKLSNECKSPSKDPFLFLKDKIGNSFDEMMQNLQNDITSLIETLNVLNRTNILKSFNAELDAVEAKVTKEEDKVSVKEEQSKLIKDDKVVFLFKLNDKLKLKGDYMRLYDALSQKEQINYFKDTFNISPLKSIVFEDIKVEKTSEVMQLESVYEVRKEIEAINKRIESIMKRITNIDEKRKEIDDDLIKYYGFTFEGGIKLLNQMIQYKEINKAKALKEANQLLVDSMVLRGRKLRDGTTKNRRSIVSKTKRKYEGRAEREIQQQIINDRLHFFDVAAQLQYYFDEGSKDDRKHVFKTFFKEDENHYQLWLKNYNGNLRRMIIGEPELEDSMMQNAKDYNLESDVFTEQVYGANYVWDVKLFKYRNPRLN
jgi:hypothetical protein